MSITDSEKQAAALQQIEKSQEVAKAPRGAGGTPGGIGTFFCSLFNALLMFGMLAGGLGLVLRSLRPDPAE